MSQEWKKIWLSEICRPKQWPTIPLKRLTKSGYPVYGANGRIGFYNKYNHEKPTILITCRGATCGQVNICEPFSYVTGNAMALDDVDEKKIDHRFFYYLLKHRGFTDTISGSAQPQITRNGLSSIFFEIPAKVEQKRIAAILDKADAIRRKRRRAVQLADEFLRSIFLDMFGDPVLNPKGWPKTKLDQVSEIVSGVTKGRKFNNKKTTWVPYMRVANVQDGHISTDDVQEIEVIETDVDKFRLEKGDILLTEGGDPDKLGRGAVWKGEVDPCIHQNHIFRVRSDTRKALPAYLSALIASPRGKRYFLRAAKQTTGVASINKTQLSNFPVVAPPLSLQQKYLSVVKSIEKIKERINFSVKSTESLFHSIAQRAFRGEL